MGYSPWDCKESNTTEHLTLKAWACCEFFPEEICDLTFILQMREGRPRELQGQQSLPGLGANPGLFCPKSLSGAVMARVLLGHLSPDRRCCG